MARPLKGLPHAFILSASQYWNATRATLAVDAQGIELFYPVGLLLGMASELALKAFLLNAGFTPKTLRMKPYGHNLEKLLITAVDKGLELPGKEASAIIAVHATHHDHFFRYGWVDDVGQRMGARKIPHFEVCMTGIGNIIDRIAADPAVLRSRLKGKAPLEWPPVLPVITPITAAQVAEGFAGFKREEQQLQEIVNKSANLPSK